MSKETALDTTNNTGETVFFRSLFNKAAKMVVDTKDWVAEKLQSQFNSAANNTKSVEPDATVDPALFATTKEDVAIAYALADRPQATKIDPRIQSLPQTLTKQPPAEYKYDPEVERVQQTLERLGFGDDMKDHGGSDGLFGPATERAVMAYQESIGLQGDEINGEITDDLFKKMQEHLLKDGLDLVTDKDLSSYESLIDSAIEAGKEPNGGITSIFKTNSEVIAETPQEKILAGIQNPLDKMLITSKFDPNRLHPTKTGDNGQPIRRAHKGIDLRTKTDPNLSDSKIENHQKPVYAAQDGTIVAAKDDGGGYGKNIVVDHGHGIRTRYAHLSDFVNEDGEAVKVGDTVKAGDMIAKSGASGIGSGAHLDFSIMRKDETGRTIHIDPEATLEANSGQQIAHKGFIPT